MAAARDIGAVADLNDTSNPAVLALIAATVEAGAKAWRRGFALWRRRGQHSPDGGAARDRIDNSVCVADCRRTAQGRNRKGEFMKDDVGKDTPGDKNVAEYKIILRKVLDNRPSGTRLKLAAALGKNCCL